VDQDGRGRSWRDERGWIDSAERRRGRERYLPVAHDDLVERDRRLLADFAQGGDIQAALEQALAVTVIAAVTEPTV
jgi:hypothetical protein